MKVEFVDVQVTLDPSRAAASAYLTAKITGRDSADAREADAPPHGATGSGS